MAHQIFKWSWQPSAIPHVAHLRSYRHKQRAAVEAALVVEGPLWGCRALLVPRLLSNPFLPVLWPMLGEDAVAVRCLRLSPGARHFGCCNNRSDVSLLGKRRLVCFNVGLLYRCLMPAAADFDGRSFDGRGGTSDVGTSDVVPEIAHDRRPSRSSRTRCLANQLESTPMFPLASVAVCPNQAALSPYRPVCSSMAARARTPQPSTCLS